MAIFKPFNFYEIFIGEYLIEQLFTDYNFRNFNYLYENMIIDC